MVRLIQDGLTTQAVKNPDKPAIVFSGQVVSYGELEAVTNQLAAFLKDSGCEKGDRVAFCVPKSPAAYVCMVGTLKAGCVYVPIDSESPAARVVKVLDSCRPRWVLADVSASKTLDAVFADPECPTDVKVGSVTQERFAGEHFESTFSFADLAGYSAEAIDSGCTEEDPAHILFTSGSTGVPKGVVITHKNVTAFVDWGIKHFGIDESDRLSGHAPLHFDLSTFDTYAAFTAGATLYPVPAAVNLIPHKVADFIRSNELTQWFSVPSVLNYLFKFDVVASDDFPKLKRLLWCGEVLPTPTLIYLMQRLPHAVFTNLYGPTEATIASSYYDVPACPADDREAVPIGRPCDGEDLMVLDENLRDVAPGVIGDLYISGVGLSPGYWLDPDKTASVFIESADDAGAGRRIYKTGDLARVDDTGIVHFLGRADTQIKSRGYRIELGEIESALSAMTALDDSAVVAIDTDGIENKAICCAYVPASDGEEVTVAQLKKQLGQAVPKYMIPKHWLSFDVLPKNANGKIHRPQLRDRFAEEFGPKETVSSGAPVGAGES